MPWLSRRELARLERQLSHALRRASAAEEALAAERQSKDWLVTQLASRIVTKHGGDGLDHELPPKPVDHPKRFTHEPSEVDLAKLEYYKQCARNAGKSEDDAVEKWEAEMRGEMPVYAFDEAEQ